jgi:transcriptional regulator with XRE-family HTH domain
MSPRSPNPVDVLIGQNIRIQRLARQMTQSDLARQLGVTFQQLQKYEKGINRVGSSRLVRIAEVLGLPVMILLNGTERAGDADAASALDLIADRQSFRLVSAFSRIEHKALRAMLVALAEGVAVLTRLRDPLHAKPATRRGNRRHRPSSRP